MKGKDGRNLSYFQSKAWMKKIAKKCKYSNRARGENSGVAKLTTSIVKHIRSIKGSIPRSVARIIGHSFGIHPTYVYHLRNPKYQKWKYL